MGTNEKYGNTIVSEDNLKNVSGGRTDEIGIIDSKIYPFKDRYPDIKGPKENPGDNDIYKKKN